MNTQYRYKPSKIEAIQFVSTPQGIADIAIFGADDFTGVNRNGNPLPAAFVGGLVIPEGSWLIRNESGMYKVLKDSVFKAVCEPAPAAVEAVVQKAAAPRDIVDEVMLPAVVSREEAKAAGLLRYFTGVPCKHGHVDERFTTSTICMTCNRENVARCTTRAKRLAKMREYSRNYYAAKRAAQAGSLSQNMSH